MSEKFKSKHKTTQLLLRIILITEYISFICLVIERMQFFKDFSLRFHEIMCIPANIALFAVPLGIIVFLYFRLCWRIQIREEGIQHKYWRLKELISVFLVLIPIIYFIYIGNRVSTSGVYESISKQHIDNKFYICIRDKNIRCTNNEYNLIDTSKEYLISFEWNKFFPNKGKLTYIEVVDKKNGGKYFYNGR